MHFVFAFYSCIFFEQTKIYLKRVDVLYFVEILFENALLIFVQTY